jgi:hypothetical protein
MGYREQNGDEQGKGLLHFFLFIVCPPVGGSAKYKIAAWYFPGS